MTLTHADITAIADLVVAQLLPVLAAGQPLSHADPDEPTPAQRAMMRIQARADLAEAQARRVARQERKKAHA